jgi:hypothetical protein
LRGFGFNRGCAFFYARASAQHVKSSRPDKAI